VVDPVLKKHHRVCPYKRGGWGPKEADTIIAADGCWHNPSRKSHPRKPNQKPNRKPTDVSVFWGSCV